MPGGTVDARQTERLLHHKYKWVSCYSTSPTPPTEHVPQPHLIVCELISCGPGSGWDLYCTIGSSGKMGFRMLGALSQTLMANHCPNFHYSSHKYNCHVNNNVNWTSAIDNWRRLVLAADTDHDPRALPIPTPPSASSPFSILSNPPYLTRIGCIRTSSLVKKGYPA